MNDKKFIQLLNLYIDGEASPAETLEVQRQIDSDPARRRIYHDYCRIQTATRSLYEQFRVGRDDEQSGTGSINASSTVPPRRTAVSTGWSAGRPFRQATYWAGGAAAACLAITLAYWSIPRQGDPRATQQVVEVPGLSIQTTTTIAAVPEPAATEPSYSAPFSPATRADPYVRLGGQAADPFSLSPSPRASDFGGPALVLNPVPAVAPVSFVPAVWPNDPQGVEEQNRKLPAILRARAEARTQAGQQSERLVPINFRAEP